MPWDRETGEFRPAPPFYPDSDEEHRSLDVYCGPEEPDDPETDEAILTNCAPEGLARPFHLDPIV